jgi:Common central domain of tyrosinase
MGIRKNAKFLTVVEKENFVRACVLLKADIVNPGAPAAQQYSKWDQYVAIHWMIQQGFAPGSPSVNFGHGGTGAYSFFSWHRYFLYRFELDLQSKVAGVMLPYWDWSDPSPIMTETFLGPNGTVGNEVRLGYFAADAPGTGPIPRLRPFGGRPDSPVGGCTRPSAQHQGR